jgi:hypothetical protein
MLKVVVIAGLFFSSMAYAQDPEQTKIRKMFEGGTTPKPEDAHQEWICSGLKPDRAHCMQPYDLSYKAGQFSAKMGTMPDMKPAIDKNALFFEGQDKQGKGYLSFRVINTPQGRRMITEESYPWLNEGEKSPVTGHAVSSYTICLHKKDFFGDANSAKKENKNGQPPVIK